MTEISKQDFTDFNPAFSFYIYYFLQSLLFKNGKLCISYLLLQDVFMPCWIFIENRLKIEKFAFTMTR